MTITSTSKDPPTNAEFDKLWTLEDTFTHPDFRLLYVPPKDEDDKMTIITPSKHEASYVPDRKFYALSHLWGTDPKDNLWDVSDFISDEDGTTVEPIPMRKEKRQTFLKLLQDNPGYWWIDVLCCRTDTPPVIMRGVYGCCEKCFAMIDCPSKAIEYFAVVLPHVEIPDQSEEFDDLDIEYMECEPSPSSDTVSFLMEGCKHAMDIWECRWFSRVWTMQELALPHSVSLLSETCDMPCYISAESLIFRLYLFRSDLKRGEYNIGSQSVVDLADHLSVLRDNVQQFQWCEEGLDNDRFESLSYVLDLFARSERSCYFAEDYVYGALGILGWDIPRLNDLEDLWDRFLSCFQRFAEELFWLAVKDLFQRFRFNFDGEEYKPCPETTTKHCQETIHFKISHEARSRTLSEACNMADVYQGLLYITIDCSCIDCELVVDMVETKFFIYFEVIRI
ncbi:hypothetical protein O0I10_007765 [Lichtheimia ornata]|uniref:Heterokaryon incompatibility domain-containing protein n=1 Tax=Lichtheimia ornata TaxID=688661 RepID=A0AAD7UZN1_9FUNG|nr:uncharacterized protein O0I10_007765 [Lichtheimia ornata]KAJ8656442.1 hypothetical protein O0I10_007765 [Lichtheimia ornata]